MKIHVLLCTRDEDDIVEESLRAMLAWADHIYVFDTGSIDHTWEIVNKLAREEPRIVPVEYRAVWFNDQLRGYLFERVRSRFSEGDWFLRADTDEFYHVSPREFIRTRLHPVESCVWHQYYDFKLTAAEVARLDTPAAIFSERLRPVAARRRMFQVSRYAEPRLCRYRKGMTWPASHTFPVNAGFVGRERLPIRHYPNRDPLQMAKRVLIRTSMIEAAQNSGQYTRVHHWRAADWRDQVLPNGTSDLQEWRDGQPLPETHNLNHLSGGGKRAVQYLFHRFVVRFADRWRSVSADIATPQDIAPEIQALIKGRLLAAQDDVGKQP